MIKSLAVATAVLGLAAAPAAAVTYDAFASFNGTNGAGGFSYGSTNGTTLTAFTAPANCASYIPGTTCINDGALPGAFKTNSGAFSYSSVNVPGDRLLLHPGPAAAEADSVYIAFTAPTSGNYVFTAQFTVQDTSPSGVGINYFLATGGSILISGLSGSLPGPVVNDTISAFLFAGDSFGYFIANGGSYNNDSTGVLASVSDAPVGVPEPATWGLMIAGFAMTGFAARRRRTTLAA